MSDHILEVLQSLFGVVKWFVDLTNFLMDELILLGESQKSDSAPGSTGGTPRMDHYFSCQSTN